MSEIDVSPPGVSLDVDYERYLRGCEKLNSSPMTSDLFRQNYSHYWSARRSVARLDSDPSWGTDWINAPRSDIERDRNKMKDLVRQLNYLHEAVLTGMQSEGEDGLEDCGVPAPLVTGPLSRSGAERLEIPVDYFEESAA